jgi:hypothetical protein
MAELIVGPLLRYVSGNEATIWVETDQACEVEVRGAGEPASAPTFSIENHHYALVVVEGLEPGGSYEYEVYADGERRWPLEGSEFPPSVIRTVNPEGPLRISFGSCRVALPHEEPYTLAPDEHDDAHGFDALYVLATEMIRGDRENWPLILLLLGDQVYVDEGSPRTRELIRTRRGTEDEPGEEVIDFEEYASLYREAWTSDRIRWLFSTVSTSMIFDDHDMSDDWNISLSWVEEIRRKPWWRHRVVAGFMTYWLYQHLGNLSPRELATNDVLEAVRTEEDPTEVLRGFAYRADREVAGTRWSFCRDLDRTRLIVMDSRAGRVLTPGDRKMVDDTEWDWISEHATGDFDHLLLGTSVPWLLGMAMHDIEAWSECVTDGCWGDVPARLAEAARRTVDFDHWGSFTDSFERLRDLIAEVASGERGEAPATVTVLSGDVHHAYLAPIAYPKGRGIVSAVSQATCSPFRNPLNSKERAVIDTLLTKGAERTFRLLAKAAGAPDPGIRWHFAEGPYYDNQVASLRIDGRACEVRLDKTAGGDDADRRLERVFDHRLS